MKKRAKIIILVTSIIFFIFGTPYQKTTYYLQSNSSEKSYGSSVPPEYDPEYGKSIKKSPTAFLRPFYISFRNDERPRDPFFSFLPGSEYNAFLSFLLNERHEKFHLYYLDFEYNDKNLKYTIEKNYVIDYKNNRMYDNDKVEIFFVDDVEWIMGSAGGIELVDNFASSFLPSIDIRAFMREIKKDEKINVRVTIAYNFDDGDMEYQYIDYLASKWSRMDWFSPLGLILLLIIPWG